MSWKITRQFRKETKSTESFSFPGSQRINRQEWRLEEKFKRNPVFQSWLPSLYTQILMLLGAKVDNFVIGRRTGVGTRLMMRNGHFTLRAGVSFINLPVPKEKSQKIILNPYVQRDNSFANTWRLLPYYRTGIYGYGFAAHTRDRYCGHSCPISGKMKALKFINLLKIKGKRLTVLIIADRAFRLHSGFLWRWFSRLWWDHNTNNIWLWLINRVVDIRLSG